MKNTINALQESIKELAMMVKGKNSQEDVNYSHMAFMSSFADTSHYYAFTIPCELDLGTWSVDSGTSTHM